MTTISYHKGHKTCQMKSWISQLSALEQLEHRRKKLGSKAPNHRATFLQTSAALHLRRLAEVLRSKRPQWSTPEPRLPPSHESKELGTHPLHLQRIRRPNSRRDDPLRHDQNRPARRSPRTRRIPRAHWNHRQLRAPRPHKERRRSNLRQPIGPAAGNNRSRHGRRILQDSPAFIPHTKVPDHRRDSRHRRLPKQSPGLRDHRLGHKSRRGCGSIDCVGCRLLR